MFEGLNGSKRLGGLSTLKTLIRKNTARVKRSVHISRAWSIALLSRRRPLMVHIVPTRRCNLECGYCNEYDKTSQPVPLDDMIERIDKLADLGTAMIAISGGEPLLHPELDQIIAHIRKRGAVASLITNGYLLTEHRIKRLNSAGLEYMQVSIDNVNPDDVSVKSLKVLDQKLVLLYKFAEFGVNVNSVIGSGVKNPQDALVVTRRASELGFTTTVGIIHDGHGQVKPLDEEQMQLYRTLKGIGTNNFGWMSGFEENLTKGKPNEWRCRAGARYLYVDEFGLVHYCSQQRGSPGLPLKDYSHKDTEREYFTKKSCAEYCTIACAQRMSWWDKWRDPQTIDFRARVRVKAERPQQEVSHPALRRSDNAVAEAREQGRGLPPA